MVAALPSTGASSMTTPASAALTYWLLSLASSFTQGSTACVTWRRPCSAVRLLKHQTGGVQYVRVKAGQPGWRCSSAQLLWCKINSALVDSHQQCGRTVSSARLPGVSSEAYLVVAKELAEHGHFASCSHAHFCL